jgi:peptide/nickel transport system permease protein
VVTLLVVTLLTSLMLSLLPGDPALAVASTDYNITADQIDQIREDLGLNDPVPVRYWNWLLDALRGDLGNSFRTRQPVADAIGDRLPVTIQLLIYAQLLSILFALVVAPLAALRPGKRFDRWTTTLSFGLLSTPSFLAGLVLIYAVAVVADLLPATGYVAFSESPIDNIKSLTLPALSLAAPTAAVYTRLLRSELINTMGEEYILIARAKGLMTHRVVFGHALRPSILPLITLVGLNVGQLIGGSVIVETLFALPGIGRLAVDSINTRDFLMVQGVVAVVTVGYVVINFFVDMSYAVADPRIRHATR